jgi:DNA gyrase inhibitor GyrI
MTLAYLRYRGEYNWKLGLHWMKFMGLLKRKHIIPHDAELYGIGYENPDFARAEQCYYDSCIRVEDGFALSPGLSTLTIPSFRYGVFPFKGTGEELQNLFFFISGPWLEEEGLYPAEGPVLQRIKAAPKGPVLDLELMLPVVKK